MEFKKKAQLLFEGRFRPRPNQLDQERFHLGAVAIVHLYSHLGTPLLLVSPNVEFLVPDHLQLKDRARETHFVLHGQTVTEILRSGLHLVPYFYQGAPDELLFGNLQVFQRVT